MAEGPGELVTVIMAAFNAGQFIDEAISSVGDQTHSNWELIIVNDGSTDDTNKRLQNFSDTRIVVIETANNGVSAARNKGLAGMHGDYFCFLDADDRLPPKSLELRLKVMQENPDVAFVDGAMVRFDAELNKRLSVQQPTFTGMPMPELIRMTGTCFSGATWLVRKDPEMTYRFKEGMTHAEDLLFYITIAGQGKYVAIEEPVYFYRTGHASVMRNIAGIRKGYEILRDELKDRLDDGRLQDLKAFERKARSIIFRSYLKAGKPIKAVDALSMFR